MSRVGLVFQCFFNSLFTAIVVKSENYKEGDPQDGEDDHTEFYKPPLKPKMWDKNARNAVSEAAWPLTMQQLTYRKSRRPIGSLNICQTACRPCV